MHNIRNKIDFLIERGRNREMESASAALFTHFNAQVLAFFYLGLFGLEFFWMDFS